MEPQSAEAMTGGVGAASFEAPASGATRLFRSRLLVLSFALWVVFGALTAVAATTTWPAGDLGVARWIQSMSWGPLTSTFDLIGWLSGGPQIGLALVAVVLVFIANRRATPFALVALADAGLYDAINSLVHKPRPVEGLVHVTEQAGAYAYPSGHATFAVTIVVVLLLCIGARVSNRAALTAAAVVGAAIVLIVGIERIYVGAHYPSDVLGGFLLASAWLTLVLSIRPLSDPALILQKPHIEA